MNLKKNRKKITLWVAIVFVAIGVYYLVQNHFRQDTVLLPLSDFMEKLEQDQIKEVAIRQSDMRVKDAQNHEFSVITPWEHSMRLTDAFRRHNVKYWIPPMENSLPLLWIFLQVILPILVFGGMWFFFFRQVQGGHGRELGFGRSKAKLSDPEKNKVTFNDVEGVEGAKEDLQEVVDFLKYPERFKSIGGVIPKGILLVGPPGTGKTLLAKAVSGEAGVPFYSISGSDFVEMFVGVGASRVRDLFAQARQHAPCIIFIDEIDAVGRHRGIGMGGGHDEREQTLNQLLVEMDGFDPKEEIIIIAATNRADVLDQALLRPGRFDRRINVDLPDIKGREAILKVHLKKITTSGVDPFVVAKGTPGFSGADLANLVNEAALWAARCGKKIVEGEDFEVSRDKILMGPERRSMVMTEEEKRLTAYHEAGHALVAHYCIHSDRIHKATIIPRGGALGMVIRLPETDRVSASRQRLLDDLAVALAGRIAEEIIFGYNRVTTGASSDFQVATRMARNMVTKWGMSDALGLVSYTPQEAGQEGGVFWSSSSTSYSEKTLQVIEDETKKLLDTASQRVRILLTNHREELELLANTLLEKETLTGEEIKQLLAEGFLPKPPAPKRRRVSRRRKEEDQDHDGEGDLETVEENPGASVKKLTQKQDVQEEAPPSPEGQEVSGSSSLLAAHA